MDVRADNGIMKTEGLFFEIAQKNKESAPFTIKERDWKGRPSMYKLYMNSVDEYDFVMSTLGSLEHWEKLCSLEWFVEGRAPMHRGLKVWRKDAEMRDQSFAKKVLKQQAQEGNVTAAKALLTPEKKITKESLGKDTPNKTLGAVADFLDRKRS